MRHGRDYPIIVSQLRITRLAAPRCPGGLVPPSRRTSQVAIVLAPAVVIELQTCCLERDFPHKMKAFKACEFIHSSFLFRLKLIIIQLLSRFPRCTRKQHSTRVKTRQDIRLLGAFGYIVENLHSGNFLHSVGTMWIYVNTPWQINALQQVCTCQGTNTNEV